MKRKTAMFLGAAAIILAAYLVAVGAVPVPHPVVAEGTLVGGMYDGQWITGKEMVPLLKGGELYIIYSLSAHLGQSIGGKPVWEEAKGCARMDIKYNQVYTVALSAPWNAMPRSAGAVGLNNNIHLEEVSQLVREQGISNAPVTIHQALQADLDGDGTKEILFTAGSHTLKTLPLNSNPQTWSVAGVRRTAEGRTTTYILAAYFHNIRRETPSSLMYSSRNSPPLFFRFLSVLDLDNDGQLEIVLRSDHHSGRGFSIHDLKGGRPQAVVTTRCGL